MSAIEALFEIAGVSVIKEVDVVVPDIEPLVDVDQ